MEDPDYTRTSALSPLTSQSRPMLGLTVLWHPQAHLIGAQFMAAADDGVISLSRYAPPFLGLDGAPAPLADLRLTRYPLSIRRDAGDNLDITAAASRMVVELNGQVLAQRATLTRAHVEQGAVLSLGGVVVLCIHWMRALPKPCPASPLLGVSDAVLALRELVQQAAATALPVLLLGETGTGKEVTARAIHAASARRQAPLVAVNMATLNETLAAADLFGTEKGAYTGAQASRAGYFAEAEHGTLFLDEIGDTPAAVQPMLLRVLESGEYRPLGARAHRHSTARLIAATDQDLARGGFNQPLLRRLEAFAIQLAPLRQRRADIGLLIAAQLAQAQADGAAAPELPAALVAQLCRCDWPGNVRQLQNVVRRLVIALRAGETPELDLLTGEAPAAPAGGPALATAVAPDAPARAPRGQPSALSPGQVLRAMDDSGWRIQQAAQLLGISRPSLYKLLDSHPQVRRPERIPPDELRAALAAHPADLARCAATLRTPGEALRRYLRSSGLIA